MLPSPAGCVPIARAAGVDHEVARTGRRSAGRRCRRCASAARAGRAPTGPAGRPGAGRRSGSRRLFAAWARKATTPPASHRHVGIVEHRRRDARQPADLLPGRRRARGSAAPSPPARRCAPTRPTSADPPAPSRWRVESSIWRAMSSDGGRQNLPSAPFAIRSSRAPLAPGHSRSRREPQRGFTPWNPTCHCSTTPWPRTPAACLGVAARALGVPPGTCQLGQRRRRIAAAGCRRACSG